MSQPVLFPRAVPAAPAGIDLRCCGVDALLPKLLTNSFDLCVIDPPWDLYSQKPGGSVDPEGQYACLPLPTIMEHMRGAAARLKPGGRLLLWTCWPLLASMPVATPPDGLEYVTGGSWHKIRPQPGAGYHWLGDSEPVLLYRKKNGTAHTDRSVLASNAHASRPTEHSEKPVGWYRMWLRRWVPPGGRVLELYAGLGPLARACHAEGVQYMGCEIDPERHATALTRLRQGVGVSHA